MTADVPSSLAKSTVIVAANVGDANARAASAVETAFFMEVLPRLAGPQTTGARMVNGRGGRGQSTFQAAEREGCLAALGERGTPGR